MFEQSARFLLITLLSTLYACGGQTIRIRDAQESAELQDEEANAEATNAEATNAEATGAEATGAEEDTAVEEVSGPPIVLGALREVPGTGVSLRAPEGSMPIPFAAGFLDPNNRIQISVMVAVGGPEILTAMRQGGVAELPEPEQNDPFSIDGNQGSIGYDQIENPNATLERSWVFVHDGERALGIVATYVAANAGRARPRMMEMLREARWNREIALNASEALGIEVSNLEGLEISPTSSSSIILVPPGASFPPEAGSPVVTVAPLPMRLPPERVQEACPQLLHRLVRTEGGQVSADGPIENGQLPGCEKALTASVQDQEIAVFAALVFYNGMPILVTGSTRPSDLASWQEQFQNVARNVRVSEPRQLPQNATN